MKKIFSILLVSVFITAIGMNVQYSLDDYGITQMNSVHKAVLAEETGTDGTGDSTVTIPCEEKKGKTCSFICKDAQGVERLCCVDDMKKV